MSMEIEDHGDVVRLRFQNVWSRAAGLDVSAYVVRGLLVDTAFRRVGGELAGALRQHPIRGAIVTHWHEDHAGNVAALARRGVPLALRPRTESLLRERPALRAYRTITWGRPDALRSPVVPLDVAPLELIHTPGHSADHQVVWDPETRTIFSGDLWLGVRSSVMHASEDPYQLVESLGTVLALEPERMFDAHRGLVATPADALRAKVDFLGSMMSDIERRVSDGWSDAAIVRQVLGGEHAAAFYSRGEYARVNLVRAVRRRVASRASA